MHEFSIEIRKQANKNGQNYFAVGYWHWNPITGKNAFKIESTWATKEDAQRKLDFLTGVKK